MNSITNPKSATMNNSNAEQALPLIVKKLICAFTGYYNGNSYRFVLDKQDNLTLKLIEKPVKTSISGKENTDKEKTPLIIIVSRAFYTEKSNQYPIENNSELKKLLALEFQQKEVSYHNWGLQDGKSHINIWQFDKSVPKALIKLPESLLLSTAIKANQVLQVLKNDMLEQTKPLFVAKLGKVIHSLYKGTVISSSQRFAMSIGLAHEEDDFQLANNQFANVLGRGLTKLPANSYLSLFQLSKIEDPISLIKKTLLPTALFFGCYLALSSAYLVYKQHQLEQQLTAQSEEINAVLSNQETFNEQLSRYRALDEFLVNKNNNAPFWLLLSELFPKAQFSNFRIENNRYILRGETEKATELLETISKFSQVQNAKFDFPTRDNRGKEVFVISFLLKVSDNKGEQ